MGEPWNYVCGHSSIRGFRLRVRVFRRVCHDLAFLAVRVARLGDVYPLPSESQGVLESI